MGTVILNYQEQTVAVDQDAVPWLLLTAMGVIHSTKSVRFLSALHCTYRTKRVSFSSLVYSMAQASKAIIPKDAGGPFGQRIGVSVGGSVGWALRVGAYVTGRSSSSDWLRYSIVVMNCGSLLTRV